MRVLHGSRRCIIYRRLGDGPRQAIPAGFRHRLFAHRAAAASLDSSPAGQQQRTQQPAVEARRQLVAATHPQTFQVAGVSFDGRQQALQKVGPGSAVQLTREPHNPYDPQAIAVHTLWGVSLGYVPRDLTAHFQFPITFGSIYSVGANEKALLGATVSVRPGLCGLALQLPPSSIAPFMDLPARVPQTDWLRLCAEAVAVTDGRCAVSGAPSNSLACHEEWVYDGSSHTIILSGLLPLHPDVARVKQLERRPQDVPLLAREARALLRAINGWGVPEAHKYLERSKKLQQLRSKEPWKLDLSWLMQHGVHLPGSSQG